MTARVIDYRNGPWVFDVLDEGPIDGTPVILLHGFPQRASSWGRVAPLLHAKGLRTIAPDQRGYSPGARPARRRDYRQSELVADVVALIDTLGVECIDLVGHDWGAAVAWSVAAMHPGRVRTLTALSVPHPAAYLRAMPRGQLPRSWYMLAFQLPVIPEKLLAAGMCRPGFAARIGLPASDHHHLATGIVTHGALTGALNWYRAIPVPDRALRVRRVQAPTTYVWSDGDIALGAAGARGCGEWVDAPYELIVLNGANHWLPETRPEEVAAAILARVKDGPDTGSATPAAKDDDQCRQQPQ